MAVQSFNASSHNGPSLVLATLKMLEYVHERISRRASVNEIEQLSDRDLLDIGVERHDIEQRIDAATRGISYRSF